MQVFTSCQRRWLSPAPLDHRRLPGFECLEHGLLLAADFAPEHATVHLEPQLEPELVCEQTTARLFPTGTLEFVEDETVTKIARRAVPIPTLEHLERHGGQDP
jgi:hypothetical protein